MSNKYLLCFSIISVFIYTAKAQHKIISGYVTDASTGEYLIGANVFDPINLRGIVSNKFGYYVFSSTGDSVCLQASFVGYIPSCKCFGINSDTTITFRLVPGTVLKEVTITSRRGKSIEKNAEMSKVEIPLEQLRTLPSITGEADILKAYQLMPGIQSGKEISNGIFVRGGTPDQNLYLLDDVPLYNVSHLGGIFTAFDPAMIKSVDFYKGGFPARYGGRISSVIDIRNKDGNLFSSHGEFGFSLFMTKIFLEGPIKKEKISYALSIRRSNLDAYAYLGGKILGNNEIVGYTFYDVNLKANYILSHCDRLFINFYQGKDRFFYREDEEVMATVDTYNYFTRYYNKWGNRTGNLRWYHVFKNHIFNNLTLAYTQYTYLNYACSKIEQIGDRYQLLIDEYQFISDVKDLIVKSDMEVPHGNFNLKAGTGYIKHFFNPGSVSYSQLLKTNEKDTLLDTPDTNLKLMSDEFASYIEVEWKAGKKLSGNTGLRYNRYWVEDNTYNSFEPRLLLNFQLVDKVAIKGSWCIMQQNLHLLTNSNTGLPSDLWIPSTANIKPEQSEQFAVGITYNTLQHFEISVEAFYKTLNNLIDYREGVLVYGNSQSWEEKIEMNGTGTVKGLEFLLQKKEGSLTGWIAYTLSENNRQFENLNRGNPYPFIYDQRHEIAVVGNYKLNEKLTISGTWVYHSGFALTLPVGRYQLYNENYSYGGNGFYRIDDVHIYTEKNGYRMPDYHRLDIGINYTKPRPRGKSVWTLGIYNVYNRQNAYYVFYKKKEGSYKLYQQSLFPILVNFGYMFRF